MAPLFPRSLALDQGLLGDEQAGATATDARLRFGRLLGANAEHGGDLEEVGHFGLGNLLLLGLAEGGLEGFNGVGSLHLVLS